MLSYRRETALQGVYSFRQKRVTDGQTERILIARPRLHSMQRGKNEKTGGYDSDSTLHKRHSSSKYSI